MFPLCFSRPIWTAGGAAAEGTAEAAVHGRHEGQEDGSGEYGEAEERPADQEAAGAAERPG